jgi:hypothetical protein
MCTWKHTQHPGIFRCPICDQTLAETLGDIPRCKNPLCRWPEDQRSINRIQAIAIYSDPIDGMLKRYKYDGMRGWSIIFGRVLAGFLNFQLVPRPDIDIVLPVPTFIGDGSRSKLAHTELVVDVADKEDVLSNWTFDTGNPRVLVQTGPKPKSAGGSWQEKYDAAQALAPLLQLNEPNLIYGKKFCCTTTCAQPVCHSTSLRSSYLAMERSV